MKIRLGVAIIIAASLISGCYAGITGRVIDAETQQPIEGAVVLVEWTKTHGIGHTYTESYKVVEALSDNQGELKIDGCYSPFVNPPELTIYKKGYVAWSSRSIFQGSQRTDFKWGDYTFKLEQFKPEYSYLDHESFVESSVNGSIGREKKQMFLKIYYQNERREVVRERNEKRKAKGD